MTATADDLPLISPFVVSNEDGSKFTTREFEVLSTKAKNRLDRERLANMTSGDYDLAHAYLICHMHAVKLGDTGLKSMSVGSFSYSQDPGVTSYLIEYRSIIDSCLRHDSSEVDMDRTRADADMSMYRLDRTRKFRPEG